MEIRYHTINGKAFKLHRNTERTFFFEARSLPLPNNSQYHGRRLARWHKQLLDHGWEETDLPNLTLDSELARSREACRSRVAEISSEKTAVEQCLRLDAVVFLVLIRAARHQAEPNSSSEDAVDFFDNFSRQLEGEVSLGRDLVAACPAADGLLNIQVSHELRRRKQGDGVYRWLSKKLKTACCNEGYVNLLHVGSVCLQARLDLQVVKQFCQSLADLWQQRLSNLWATL